MPTVAHYTTVWTRGLTRPLLQQRQRLFSSIQTPPLSNGVAHCLVYSKYGPPAQVLELVETPLPSLQPETVKIKFLASPINPADVNQIEGTYPSKAREVAAVQGGNVGGNEGLAEVLAVGNKVKNLKVGDWVLPKLPGFGTWRTHACVSANELQVLPRNGLPIVEGATIAINPSTAYRMLKDFVQLKKGDYVIQNGANSAVGQAVIQLAKAWGINTINIIRRPDIPEGGITRPSFEETSNHLIYLGATHVIAQEDLRNQDVRTLIKSLDQPIRLGLNCVGGRWTTELARYLGQSATLVTYGGMSREPVTIPTSLFIFKDLSLRGFWLTQWVANRERERELMLTELSNLVREGKLKAPKFDLVPWGNVPDVSMLKAAVGKSGTGGHKQLFLLNSLVPESSFF